MEKTKVNLPHQKITEFCKKNHIIRLSLFGSILRDDFQKNSDIDFLVEFDKPSFDKYIGLKQYLEKLFRKKVDIVLESDLKPRLIYVKEETEYVKGL